MSSFPLSRFPRAFSLPLMLSTFFFGEDPLAFCPAPSPPFPFPYHFSFFPRTKRRFASWEGLSDSSSRTLFPDPFPLWFRATLISQLSRCYRLFSSEMLASDLLLKFFSPLLSFSLPISSLLFRIPFFSFSLLFVVEIYSCPSCPPVASK